MTNGKQNVVYHDVTIERKVGLGLLMHKLSFRLFPAMHCIFLAQTPTCPVNQLSLGPPRPIATYSIMVGNVTSSIQLR